MLGPQDHRLDHAVRWGQRWAGRRSRTEGHDAALLRRNRVEVPCPVLIAPMMALMIATAICAVVSESRYPQATRGALRWVALSPLDYTFQGMRSALSCRATPSLRPAGIEHQHGGLHPGVE